MLSLFKHTKKQLNPGDVVICDDAKQLCTKSRDTRVVMPVESRMMNTLILGPAGSGKTTNIILPMVAQDAQNSDWGMTILSSKDELPLKAYLLAKENCREAIYFDPAKNDCPKFNPLSGLEVDVVENFVTTFKKLDPDSPQFFKNLNEQLLRNAVKVLKRMDQAEGVEGKNATLINLNRLLQNFSGQGREMVNKFSHICASTEKEAADNRDISSWFLNDYFSEGSKVYENTSGIRSQIAKLVDNEYLHSVLNPDFDKGERNEINFEECMAQGTVICVSTAERTLRDLSKYLACFFTLAVSTALLRYRGYGENRRSQALYIDEFLNPALPCLRDILIHSKDLKVSLVMTAQSLSMLRVGGGREKPLFVEILRCNSRNIILLPGITKADAESYAKYHFAREMPVSDLIFADYNNLHYCIWHNQPETDGLALGRIRPLPAEISRKLEASAQEYKDSFSV